MYVIGELSNVITELMMSGLSIHDKMNDRNVIRDQMGDLFTVSNPSLGPGPLRFRVWER